MIWLVVGKADVIEATTLKDSDDVRSLHPVVLVLQAPAEFLVFLRGKVTALMEIDRQALKVAPPDLS